MNKSEIICPCMTCTIVLLGNLRKGKFGRNSKGICTRPTYRNILIRRKGTI